MQMIYYLVQVIASTCLFFNPLLHRYIYDRQLFKTLWEKEKLFVTSNFLFQQFFLLNPIIVSPILHTFDIISLFAVELEEPKIGLWGKGIIVDYGRKKKKKCISFSLSVFTMFLISIFSLNVWYSFFRCLMGKTLQSPSLLKPRKDVNNVSCSHDMT